jgi:hypothetical protein
MAGRGAAAVNCKKCGSNARNVSSESALKLLILGSPVFGYSAPRSQSAVALSNRGKKALPVQFDGARYDHSRITGEEWRNEGLKFFHFPQLPPVGFVSLFGTAGIGIKLDLSFQRGNRFPVLFQSLFLDFCGNILKPFKFRQGQPSFKRIRFALDSSAPLYHAINGSDEISPVESIDQRAVVCDDKGGDFSRGSTGHGVQGCIDYALQVSIHKHPLTGDSRVFATVCKYALRASLAQELRRNSGTTTAHWQAESSGQMSRGLPLIQKELVWK